VSEQILINAELKSGKKGQEAELSGGNPLRRGRSSLVCSALQ